MTRNYLWTDDPTEANVAVYDTDILNDCLMHLKYQNENYPKFCVNSASIDSNGNPNLLTYTGNTVKFNCGNSIVPVMTSNSQSEWTLSGSHQVVSSSNDLYKSFDNSNLDYCSLQHTPSEESPAFITIEKSADFSFEYLYLKFKTIINSGDIKSFRVLDTNDNTLYSYDNFGDCLNKDEFLIPIFNFNTSKLKLVVNSNVNDVTYTNFPSIIKLLDKSQVVTLTNTKGKVSDLVSIIDFTIPSVASKTYNIFIGTDGIVEAFSTSLTKGNVLPATPSVDQVHLLTCSEPIQAKKYNGTVWELYTKVPVGYAKTNSSSVVTEVGTFVYNQNGYNINSNTSIETFLATPIVLLSGVIPTSSTQYNTGLTSSVVYCEISSLAYSDTHYSAQIVAKSDVITTEFIVGRYGWSGSVYGTTNYVEIPTKNGIINFRATYPYNSSEVKILGYRKMTGV